MTKGEMMVWAAVFALEIQEMKGPKPNYLRDSDNYSKAEQEWIEAIIISAIESAGYAVEYLRDAKKRIEDGWGCSVVSTHYNEIGGEDK
jgi:hypothetical protein